MDRETSLELIEDDQVVNVGGRVRVNWLNNWYEGEVVEIAPQKDLYQVIESQSGLTIILHISQMKPIDKSRSAHERFTVGAEVGFYDSDLAEWMGGTIQAVDVPASIIVKWKGKNGLENFNWFDAKDVAPIFENEAFGIEDFKPQQSTTKLPEINESLSFEDILEEKPVYRRNEVFESPDKAENPLEDHLPDIEQLFEDYQPPKQLGRRKTSVSMKEFYAKRFQKKSTNQHKAKNGDLHHYLENQHDLLHGKLDHSVLPAIWSYLHSSSGKGIPHHPTSRFFFFHDSKIKRTQSSMFASHLPRSPTMISRPESEPVPYASVPFRKNTAMTSGGQYRKIKKHGTNMSLRPLPPVPDQPYEIPLSSFKKQTPQRKLQKGGSSGEIYDKINDTNSTSGTLLKNRPQNQGLIIRSTSPRKQMVSAGGSVTLFCEVESATPVTFEWFKDGTKVTHNDEQIAFPEPGKLQLYGLNLCNVGRYRCDVTNTLGMSDSFECTLRVEEETLKRSFSREMGLHKLALGDQQKVAKAKGEKDENSSVSQPNLEDQEGSTSRLPVYDFNSFSFLKSPSSMDLTRELLDKDVQRLEEAERKKNSEKEENARQDESPSPQTSGTAIDERKTHKDKRRRTSNVILGEMDSYLEGYGENYGQSSHVLDAPEDGIKKQKKKKKIKGQSKAKKKSSKVTNSDDANYSEFKKKMKKSKKTSDSKLETEDAFAEEATGEVDLTLSQPIHFEIPEITIEEVTMTMPPEGMIQSEGEGEEVVDPLKLDDSLMEEPDHSMLFEREVIGEEEFHKNGPPGERQQLVKHNMISRSSESIDACPEYDSFTSVSSSDGEQGEGGLRADKVGSSNVDLPLELEHYTESVKRLQISAQKYEDEHFGKGESSKSTQGLLNKIFKSDKSDRQEN